MYVFRGGAFPHYVHRDETDFPSPRGRERMNGRGGPDRYVPEAGRLAESLADARPETERRTAGQGEPAHDAHGSGCRERAEVVAVDLVLKGALARLVQTGELEGRSSCRRA